MLAFTTFTRIDELIETTYKCKLGGISSQKGVNNLVFERFACWNRFFFLEVSELSVLSVRVYCSRRIISQRKYDSRRSGLKGDTRRSYHLVPMNCPSDGA